MNGAPRRSRGSRITVAVVATILLTLVTSIVLVSLTFHTLVLGGQWALTSDWLRSTDPQARSAALGQLGDYFGGTLNPILSFSGFLVLLVTVVLQRRQLAEGTRQLAESTRAIDLEAFVRVNDLLQTADGIAARARLLERLRQARFAQPSEPPDSPLPWSPEERQAVQTVVRQFELVGLLIEGRLFDPNLFFRSWQHDITLCWLACETAVMEQRAEFQHPSYGRHFEELHRLASACRQVDVSQHLGYEQVPPGETGQRPESGEILVRPHVDG